MGANEAALGKKRAFSLMGIRAVSAMGIRCCVKEAINQALAFVNLACPVSVQSCTTLRWEFDYGECDAISHMEGWFPMTGDIQTMVSDSWSSNTVVQVVHCLCHTH